MAKVTKGREGGVVEGRGREEGTRESSTARE